MHWPLKKKKGSGSDFRDKRQGKPNERIFFPTASLSRSDLTLIVSHLSLLAHSTLAILSDLSANSWCFTSSHSTSILVHSLIPAGILSSTLRFFWLKTHCALVNVGHLGLQQVFNTNWIWFMNHQIGDKGHGAIWHAFSFQTHSKWNRFYLNLDLCWLNYGTSTHCAAYWCICAQSYCLCTFGLAQRWIIAWYYGLGSRGGGQENVISILQQERRDCPSRQWAWSWVKHRVSKRDHRDDIPTLARL